MERLVSIIIPNFNYGCFLPAAIASALEQTYAQCEVIVVDDGSTDESRAIIAQHGSSISAILKRNGGQASALNAGLRAAKGDVIIFHDADDLLVPTAAERAIQAFDGPDVVKVHWPMRQIDAQGNARPGLYPDGPLAEGDLREAVLKHGPHSFTSSPGGGAAWSRRFLDQVCPIPEATFRTGSDLYLISLAPLFGRMRAIAEPQSCYRRPPRESISQRPSHGIWSAVE
jgi:glycosyltransferase involved in cell wall biosynthesis